MSTVRARRTGLFLLRSIVFLIALAIAGAWLASFWRAGFARSDDYLFALGKGSIDWWHEDDVPEFERSLQGRGAIRWVPPDEVEPIPGKITLAAIWVGMFAVLFVRPVLHWLLTRLSPAKGRLALALGAALFATSLSAWVATQFRLVHVRSPWVGACGYIGSLWVSFEGRLSSPVTGWSAGMMPTEYFPRSCTSCESAYLGHETGGYPNRQVNFLWPALAGLGLWTVGREARVANLERLGLCPKCGYWRMGDTSDRCPECGNPGRPQGAMAIPV